MTRRRTTALQNPYRGASGYLEPGGGAARAASLGALAVGAALAGGILTGQVAHADEADGGTTCETDRDGRRVGSADGTPCDREPGGEGSEDRDSGDGGSEDRRSADEEGGKDRDRDRDRGDRESADQDADDGDADDRDADHRDADHREAAAGDTREERTGTAAPDRTGPADPSTVPTRGGAPAPSGRPNTSATGGGGVFSADPRTGEVFDGDGVRVDGLAFDPATATVVPAYPNPDPVTTGTVSPALLSPAGAGSGGTAPVGGVLVGSNGTPVRGPAFDPAAGEIVAGPAGVVPSARPTATGAATTSAPGADGAALLRALTAPTPEQREEPSATGAPAADGAAADRERDAAARRADGVVLGHLLNLVGAALHGGTDGIPGSVAELLRREGIDIVAGTAADGLTDLTGTEAWSRGLTPGVRAVLDGITGPEPVDWQQVQEAAIAGLSAEGIRQLGPVLESGVLDAVPDAGGAAIGALLSPDGLTREELGALAEDVAIDTAQNLLREAAPGVGGAALTNGVGSILGMFADPDTANPVHFVSAVANTFLPGAGLALTPLANWFAKERMRHRFEEQIEQLNRQAETAGMTAVSQFRDPSTMAPLTLSNGTTFRWADGRTVLDPNSGELRPYGTAFYQDGIDTLERMTDIGDAIPDAARLAQEAEVARIQANLDAGLNGDGSPRTREQQRRFEQISQLLDEGNTRLAEFYAGTDRGLYMAPDPADVPVEPGGATGWRAHAIAVEQNEEARELDPTHAAAGVTSRETDVRADAAAAAERFGRLYLQQRWAMADHQPRAPRGSIAEPPPLPDADEMREARTEAIRNAAALRIADSTFADDAERSLLSWSEECLSGDEWDEEECGPEHVNGPRGTARVQRGRYTERFTPVEDITAERIGDEVEDPSEETRRLVEEIRAERDRLGTPQVGARYEQVVEDRCGEEGHAGQYHCYGAWNQLLHPYGGAIPYPAEVATLMARAHAAYAARKQLLGHDVLQDPLSYILGPPLQPAGPRA